MTCIQKTLSFHVPGMKHMYITDCLQASYFQFNRLILWSYHIQ